ncbi:hypothetical protein J4E93_005605 [Alternaria ventricosa]|uniref:uncharacterized protein n=1 Tax=Alternaria ventricosa TaxID=1187951 RepID=UPI0020C1EEB6|nr:uncharacterized protein J4E93_005605 [Alternaria ventricosa]KAI4646026.1 hypothetical protein J4E93_005605 [Alternaria ventricosa]
MPPKKGGQENGGDEKGKRDGKKSDNIKFNGINMAKLKSDLGGARTNQETVRKQIEELLPQYLGLSAGERAGFLKNKGKVFKKLTRNNAAARLTRLQSELEDFLYYQNTVNRRLRFNPDRPTAVQKEDGRRLNMPPMLISSHGDDPRKVQYLRNMLEYYDRREVGTGLSRYREANIETGEVDDGTGAPPILVEPEDLHLITPMWRRAPGGLREEEERLALEQAARDPIQFRVNEEAIEARRAEFENIVDDDADLEYRTHTERRAAELGVYADTRPSTANVLVETNAEGGQVDEDRFRGIQTASGVFVAARESSHDWLTSYDCLGLVKICGIPEHFETSAVRDEDQFYDSPDEDEDFDAPFDPPSDEMEGGNDGEHEEGVGPANDGANEDLEDDEGDDLPVDGDGEAPQATDMSAEEPDDTGRQLRNGKQLSSSPMPKAKRVRSKTGGAQAVTVSQGAGNDAGPAKGSKKKGASKPAPGNGTKGPTEDESRRRVTASIDYPYNKREFCLPKKTRWVEDGRLLSTVWAEATDEEAQHKKIKWNMDPDLTDSGDEYDEGDEGESDDEGDLFRISYERGSFPNGRPAPVIPPTMAPGPTAPDDIATASAATEAVAPAEDDEVGAGAEDL